MPSREAEIAWAAGLFEGEGCFYQRPDKALRTSITMTDLDILERFCRIIGLGSVRVHTKHVSHQKQPYVWSVSHYGAVEVYEMLKPWLGPRRCARAEEIIESHRQWKQRHGEATCICGTVFIKRQPNQMSCSRPCNNERHNKLRRDARRSAV